MNPDLGQVRPGKAPIGDRLCDDKAGVHKWDSHSALLLGDEPGKVAGIHFFVSVYLRATIRLRTTNDRFYFYRSA